MQTAKWCTWPLSHPMCVTKIHRAAWHRSDMFLVSDSCSTPNHVKPQPCVLMSARQEAWSTVRACPTCRLHAFSASQTCKQLHFPSEVVFWRCVVGFFLSIFFCLPEVGELNRRGQGGGAGGGQERLGCSWTWAVAFGGADCTQVYISGAVGVKHTKDLLPAEVSWRGSAWPVGPKSIRVFSQLMNYEMRNGSLSPGFRISPKRAPTYCNDLKRKQILLASHAKSVRCVHARTQESGA